MTAPIQPGRPLEPLTPAHLRTRHHALSVHRNRYYEKGEVDNLLAQALGTLDQLTRRTQEAEERARQIASGRQGLGEVAAQLKARAEHAERALAIARSELRSYRDSGQTDVPEVLKQAVKEAEAERDRILAEAQEQARVLLEETEAHCAALTAEADERRVGPLVEPRRGTDDVEYAEAVAEFVTAAERYLADMRTSTANALAERAERMLAACRRLEGDRTAPA